MLSLLQNAHHNSDNEARIESGKTLITLLEQNGMHAELIERSHDRELPSEVREEAKKSILKAAVIGSLETKSDAPLIYVATCERVPNKIREDAALELFEGYTDKDADVDEEGLHKICSNPSFPLIIREKAGKALVDFLYLSNEVRKLREIIESPTNIIPYIVRIQACQYFFQFCLEQNDDMPVAFLDLDHLPHGIRIEAEGWIEKMRLKAGLNGSPHESIEGPKLDISLLRDIGQSRNGQPENAQPKDPQAPVTALQSQILQADECWKPATSFSGRSQSITRPSADAHGREPAPKSERKLPR